VSSSILPRSHHLYTNGVIGLTERTDRSMQSQNHSRNPYHVIDVSRGSEHDQSEKHVLAIRERESRTDINEVKAQNSERLSLLSDELSSQFWSPMENLKVGI